MLVMQYISLTSEDLKISLTSEDLKMSFQELGSIRLPTLLGTSSFTPPFPMSVIPKLHVSL